MKLTQEMHDAVANSEVGQFINRLIKEAYLNKSTEEIPTFKGNVIQALWDAFMSGAEGKSFRDIKSSFASGSGSAVSGE